MQVATSNRKVFIPPMDPAAAVNHPRNHTEGAKELRANLAQSMADDPPVRKLMLYQGAPMAEPTSSAAGGILAWKALGGIAAIAAIGAAFAAIVAMCMMTPRSPKEWAVGIISSVISSLGGGALVIIKFGLLTTLPSEPLSLYLALVALLGVVFACGLPGWALVRWCFTWIERQNGKDLAEVAAQARADASRIILP